MNVYDTIAAIALFWCLILMTVLVVHITDDTVCNRPHYENHGCIKPEEIK